MLLHQFFFSNKCFSFQKIRTFYQVLFYFVRYVGGVHLYQLTRYKKEAQFQKRENDLQEKNYQNIMKVTFQAVILAWINFNQHLIRM